VKEAFTTSHWIGEFTREAITLLPSRLMSIMVMGHLQTQGYWSTAPKPFNRSPFSMSHIVSITIDHKNYKVSLPLDLNFSWLWVIHKPMLHQSPFSRPHIVSIIVFHKHYKVSLSSDLGSSWLWVNHTKPFSLLALHIQQRLLRMELHAMETTAS